MSLEIRALSLKMGEKIICQNFSQTLQPGEVWGILGKNGVGKSSFLLALCQLRSLQSGAIYFKQQLIKQLPQRKQAQIMGLVQQEQNYIFPNSVYETVMAGRHPYCRRLLGESNTDKHIVNNILEEFELEELKYKNITELSGGEKQRVAIASLFAQQTDILLLDEPCTHLDISYQCKILDKLRQLAKQQNKLVIMVLHDINLVAQYCDKVILFFEQGYSNVGDAKALLNTENLTALYQHPMQIIESGAGKYYATFSATESINM